MGLKRLLVVGQIRSATLNSLSNRYLVEIVHRFQSTQELLGHGKGILQNGAYDTVLIGAGIDPDRRKQLLNFLTQKEATHVGVLTKDSSYESWRPIAPDASPDQIAEHLGFLPRSKPAQIIIVCITKGGAGKSTVSTNTAITLAQKGYRVALIDDDPTSRSVRPLMGVPKDTPYTSANLMAEIDANERVITPQLIQKYLVPAHGVDCLIGPSSIVSQYPVDVETAKDILAILGHDLGYDFVVIDAPPDIVNSASYSYWLLKTTDNGFLPPIVLVPVAPERLVILSAEDTVTAVTYLNHPLERVWPVVSCTQVTHDARSLRPPSTALWREPATVVPYCPNAKDVADTGRPFVVQQPDPLLLHLWRTLVLDVAGIQEIKTAFNKLADQIVEHAPRNED